MKKEKTIREMCEYLFHKKKYKKIEIARTLGISHSVVHYHLNEDYRERHKVKARESHTRTRNLLKIKAKKILESYPQMKSENRLTTKNKKL